MAVAAHQCHKDFLGDIFGLLLGAHVTDRDVEDGALVTGDELVEGRQVTTTRAFDQRGVRFAFVLVLAAANRFWITAALSAGVSDEEAGPWLARLRRHIAAEQASRIEAAAQGHALVICDTTPLITALCSEHYFEDSSLTAAALAFQRRCDLTLLCAPDLPWEA